MMEYFTNRLSEVKGVNPPKTALGTKKMVKLCECAEKLFNENGFYETSVADICKAANTAVGTFYIYFSDKTALYNYLVKNYYVVIRKVLHEHTKGFTTRREIEFEGLKAFIRFGNQNPQCFKIIWGSIYANPELFEQYYVNFAKGYVRALKRYSNELIDVDCASIAYMLMGIANFVCLKTVFDKKCLTESEITALAVDTMTVLTKGLFVQQD